MNIRDIVILTVLFLSVVIAVAVLVILAFQYGYRAGEEVGEMREKLCGLKRIIEAHKDVSDRMKSVIEEVEQDWPGSFPDSGLENEV